MERTPPVRPVTLPEILTRLYGGTVGEAGSDARVRILGPLEMDFDGRALSLPSPVERSVVAALALRGGQPVSLEHLGADIWGDDRPQTWRKNIHVRVARLRQRIEAGTSWHGTDVIVTVDHGYRLGVRGGAIDAVRFEEAFAAGQRLLAEGRIDEAEAALAEAVGLWRGDAVPELADGSTGQAEATRLGELRQAAVETWHDAMLALGRDSVVAAIEASVVSEPLRERRWGQLMLALYRTGRQGDALRAYQRARAVLGDELGIEPGPDLRRLEAAIVAHDPELLQDAPSAPRPDGYDRRSSPAARPPTDGTEPSLDWIRRQQAVPLVDRTAEVAQLVDVWTGVRDREVGGFVVITGDAGAGKTRLIAEVADLAARDGALVLATRCVAGGSWTSLLAAVAGVGGPVPEAAWVPGSTAALEYAVQATARFRELALHRPMLLLFDDVQWADADLVALARFLHDAPMPLDRTIPFMGVFALRSGCPPPPGMAGLMEDLNRVVIQCRLEVPPLGPDDGAALLVECLGRPETAADPRAVAEIVRDTGGNPGYLVQVGQHLAGRPVVAGGLSAVGVPETLRAAVSDRVAAQPPGMVRLLLAASVLGPEFRLTTAAVAAGLDEDTALDLLDEATVSRFVEPVKGEPDAFRFVTAVERLVLLDRLSGARRRRIEARLAAAAT